MIEIFSLNFCIHPLSVKSCLTKLELNKIAARWPAKAVTQFSIPKLKSSGNQVLIVVLLSHHNQLSELLSPVLSISRFLVYKTMYFKQNVQMIYLSNITCNWQLLWMNYNKKGRLSNKYQPPLIVYLVLNSELSNSSSSNNYNPHCSASAN